LAVSNFFSKARVWRWFSCASSGRDQKSGAEAFSLRPSSALRAASRSKIAAERAEALRGGRESGNEIVAFGHWGVVSRAP
jgi:hypothetical protein